VQALASVQAQASVREQALVQALGEAPEQRVEPAQGVAQERHVEPVQHAEPVLLSVLPWAQPSVRPREQPSLPLWARP